MLRLNLGTQHHAVVESKKHLARVLVQIQVVLTFSTKLLKDHSFRLKLASVGRLNQGVFTGNKPLQSAISELERLVTSVTKIQHMSGRHSRS
jgi:hypothetical protein